MVVKYYINCYLVYVHMYVAYDIRWPICDGEFFPDLLSILLSDVVSLIHVYVHIAEHLTFSTKFQYDNSSGFLPVNTHAEVNILNINYIVSFIFYSSMTKLLNDMHFNCIHRMHPVDTLV